MRIHFTVEGHIVATALLDYHDSAKDLAALLPVTLVLKDYEAVEKIADLPRALVTTGAPAGHAPHAGDLCYYAPWGNLAVFHQGAEFTPGLVRLGRLVTGLEALRQPGEVSARLIIAA
jgi:hypothetical protein